MGPRRTRRTPTQSGDSSENSCDHCLVKFLTDDQSIIVAKSTQVRTGTVSTQTFALWLPNFRWYRAELLGQGSKAEMEALKADQDLGRVRAAPTDDVKAEMEPVNPSSPVGYATAANNITKDSPSISTGPGFIGLPADQDLGRVRAAPTDDVKAEIEPVNPSSPVGYATAANNITKDSPSISTGPGFIGLPADQDLGRVRAAPTDDVMAEIEPVNPSSPVGYATAANNINKDSPSISTGPGFIGLPADQDLGRVRAAPTDDAKAEIEPVNPSSPVGYATAANNITKDSPSISTGPGFIGLPADQDLGRVRAAPTDDAKAEIEPVNPSSPVGYATAANNINKDSPSISTGPGFIGLPADQDLGRVRAAPTDDAKAEIDPVNPSSPVGYATAANNITKDSPSISTGPGFIGLPADQDLGRVRAAPTDDAKAEIEPVNPSSPVGYATAANNITKDSPSISTGPGFIGLPADQDLGRVRASPTDDVKAEIEPVNPSSPVGYATAANNITKDSPSISTGPGFIGLPADQDLGRVKASEGIHTDHHTKTDEDPTIVFGYSSDSDLEGDTYRQRPIFKEFKEKFPDKVCAASSLRTTDVYEFIEDPDKEIVPRVFRESRKKIPIQSYVESEESCSEEDSDNNFVPDPESSIENEEDEEDEEDEEEEFQTPAQKTGVKPLKFSPTKLSKADNNFVPDHETLIEDEEDEADEEEDFQTPAQKMGVKPLKFSPTKLSKADNNFVPDHETLIEDEEDEADEEEDFQTPAQKMGVNPLKFSPTKLSKAKKLNGKRVWDKKYFCKFCNEFKAKLPRHLEAQHSEEAEVGRFLSHPKNSKTRKMLIASITSDGQKLYNFKLLRSPTKVQGPCRELQLKKRLASSRQEAVSVSNYLPCPHCSRMLSHQYLARHVHNSCPVLLTSGNKQPESDPSEKKKSLKGIQTQCALMLPAAADISKEFKKDVLSKMTYGEVYSCILNDKLIISFGVRLYDYLKRSPTRLRLVRDRLRELGRLLIEAKKISSNVTCLSDLINPTKYNILVAAAKIVAGYNQKTGEYTTPSLALKIGHSMKKCASRYKGMCMDHEDLLYRLPQIKLFEERLNENWTMDVTGDAHTTLKERKWNAPKRIPVANDVRLLNKYLVDQETIWKEKLQRDRSEVSYRKFTEVVLCRTLLFNRRRVGESQYMLLQDYVKSKNLPPAQDSEIFAGLTEVEKILVQSLHRFEIRGKKGRMVPVILTESLQSSVELIVSMRSAVGVPDENKFLFPALHASDGHYRADVILRQMSIACGASSPETLRATQLRKHVATMVQLLNLKENELDAVATYMGHDIRVHKEFYRLPHDTMQLAKISKLLLTMEGGDINRMKGTNLSDIVVDDLIEAEVDANEEEPEEPEEPPASPQSSNSKKRGPSKESNGKEKKQKSSAITQEERQLIKEYFKKLIDQRRAPRQGEVLKFLEANPSMSDIPWGKIKNCVYNAFPHKRN